MTGTRARKNLAEKNKGRTERCWSLGVVVVEGVVVVMVVVVDLVVLVIVFIKT